MRKTPSFEPFYVTILNTIVLPRQAQGKHRENNKKGVLCRGQTVGSLVGYGDSAGEGGSALECHFVHFHAASGYYYLFRTQEYSPKGGQTSVYASRDPSNFGVGDQSDAYLVARLPFCAPEIVELSGR